jgi:tRNA threonylcarbamoyladenosine biosynthesis protein TsaB
LSYLLHIETATPVCSVVLSFENKILGLRETTEENAHSSCINIFIEECLKEEGIEAAELNAVSLSAGPGSYTGLRIGAATAKGLCYALNIPLVSVSTLQAMAAGFLLKNDIKKKDFLLCPMIDARRMEVYYALYDKDLAEVRPPSAKVVKEDFLADAGERTIIYFGTGSEKCREVIKNKNMEFAAGNFNSAANSVDLAMQKFQKQELEDVALFEPLYIKEFFTQSISCRH